MKELVVIFNEYKNNIMTIWHLSLYQLRITYKGTILGQLWAILNPMIQIGVYWLVFGIGLRSNRPIDGIPFIAWMIVGLVPWFWISPSITHGSTCVRQRLKVISKMNFPLSLINGYVMFAEYIQHVIMMIICFLVVIITHHLGNFNIGILVYYSIAAFTLLLSLSFLNSTLDIFIPDMRFLIPQLVRMLFYLTGVIWVPNALSGVIKAVFYFNPFYYIINGFRQAILHNDSSAIISYQGLYFWVLTIMIMLLGAKLHIRLRKQFVDNL